MLNINTLNTTPIGATTYTDSKSNIYTVRHSVLSEPTVSSDELADELYRIFTTRAGKLQ